MKEPSAPTSTSCVMLFPAWSVIVIRTGVPGLRLLLEPLTVSGVEGSVPPEMVSRTRVPAGRVTSSAVSASAPSLLSVNGCSNCTWASSRSRAVGSVFSRMRARRTELLPPELPPSMPAAGASASSMAPPSAASIEASASFMLDSVNSVSSRDGRKSLAISAVARIVTPPSMIAVLSYPKSS